MRCSFGLCPVRFVPLPISCLSLLVRGLISHPSSLPRHRATSYGFDSTAIWQSNGKLNSVHNSWDDREQTFYSSLGLVLAGWLLFGGVIISGHCWTMCQITRGGTRHKLNRSLSEYRVPNNNSSCVTGMGQLLSRRGRKNGGGNRLFLVVGNYKCQWASNMNIIILKSEFEYWSQVWILCKWIFMNRRGSWGNNIRN